MSDETFCVKKGDFPLQMIFTFYFWPTSPLFPLFSQLFSLRRSNHDTPLVKVHLKNRPSASCWIPAFPGDEVKAASPPPARPGPRRYLAGVSVAAVYFIFHRPVSGFHITSSKWAEV